MRIQKRWQLAEQAFETGNLTLAESHFHDLLRFPEFALVARFRLSQIAGKRGNLRAAAEQTLAAVNDRVAPDPEGLSTLVDRLLTLGEAEAAVSVAERPALLQSRDVRALSDAGRTLYYNDLTDQAFHLLSRCVELGADGSRLHHMLGGCHLRRGDIEAAERSYRRSLELEPGAPPVHWSLAKLRRQVPESNHVDVLRGLLETPPARPDDEAVLCYALFKELDDLGDHAAAWPWLERGMQLQRGQSGYDINAELALLERIESVDAELPPPTPATTPDAATVSPIFIVGLPRAGSTLLERAFGLHSQVHGGGELTDFPRQVRMSLNLASSAQLDESHVAAMTHLDPLDLGRRYRKHVAWRAQGKTRLTDKLPVNFRFIGAILRAMPDARIVHIHRDPVAACFANLREYFFGGNYGYSYEQEEVATYVRAHRRLMATFDQRYPGRVLSLPYAELASSPDVALQRTFEHCGLVWEPQCGQVERNTAQVSTASATQVREPIHTRSVAHWRNYEAQLQPMIDALGALATAGDPA
ncbi:MAG: sulfotransferase [Xanthomonadales bacterium]|nr:sulfotransferase [Xanthomonadales bacterium]